MGRHQGNPWTNAAIRQKLRKSTIRWKAYHTAFSVNAVAWTIVTELEHCNEININQTKDQFSELRLFGRMNGAVTKGFEEDVGNRTSVYVHTAYSITASPSVFGTYGYKSAPHDEVLKLRQDCDTF